MAETYIVGNENGEVLVQCENEGCQDSDGMWYLEPITIYRPTPDQIKAEWAAHIFTHYERDTRD